MHGAAKMATAGRPEPGPRAGQVSALSRGARLVVEAEELAQMAETVAGMASRIRDNVLGGRPQGEDAPHPPPQPGLLGAIDVNLSRIRRAVIDAQQTLSELGEAVQP